MSTDVSEEYIEATYSSETSIDFQRTARRYTPEDGTLHKHRRENLKSYRNDASMKNLHEAYAGKSHL
jgi:hypothetical protein